MLPAMSLEMQRGVAGYPFASFGNRLGAYLLDLLLYSLVAFPFLIAGVALGVTQFDCDIIGGEIMCDVERPGLVVLAVVIVVVGYGLAALLYLSAMARTGQTWGARAAGVRVIDANGMPPGWGKALGRGLFQLFISGNISYIGYLWMLWDDNSQTLHDKVVDTYVVRVNVSRPDASG